jgi:hypothetical protein
VEGKPRGLLKKFYLVGALGLSDATERRYGVVGPRRGRAVSSATSYELKTANGEKESEKERVLVVYRDFRSRSVLSRCQLPSVSSARTIADIRERRTAE